MRVGHGVRRRDQSDHHRCSLERVCRQPALLRQEDGLKNGARDGLDQNLDVPGQHGDHRRALCLSFRRLCIGDLDGNVVVWEEHTSEKWRDVLCDELNDTESTEYTKMIQAQMQTLSKKTALYTIVQRKQKNKITHHPDHIRSRLEHGKDKAHLGDRLIKHVDTCSLYEQICTNRPDHNVACPVDPCVVKIRHDDHIGTGIAVLCGFG